VTTTIASVHGRRLSDSRAEIQIYGGAHAAGRVDLQDFMVMPLGASSFAEACEWTVEVYRVAGERLEASGRRQGVADEATHA
jgi:enolase